MAKQRRKREPDGGDPAFAGVLRALRGLSHPPVIDPSAAADPLRLAALLCERSASFQPDAFMEFLATLLSVPLFEAASEHVRCEHLLLDPREVALAALMDLYLEAFSGRSGERMDAWLRRVVARVARERAGDPELFLYRNGADDSPEEGRFAFALCRLLNGLMPDARRIVWLVMMEGVQLRDVARSTGVPLERVEFVVDRVVREARDWSLRRPKPGRRERKRERGESGGGAEEGHES